MSRTEEPSDALYHCPLCGAEIRAPVERETSADGSPRGPKSPGAELVVCPNCDEVIDGFRAH